MLTTRPLPGCRLGPGHRRRRRRTRSHASGGRHRRREAACRSPPLRRRRRPPRRRDVGGVRRPTRSARTVNSTACCSRYVASRSTIDRATTPRTPTRFELALLDRQVARRRSAVDRGRRDGDDELRDARAGGRPRAGASVRPNAATWQSTETDPDVTVARWYSTSGRRIANKLPVSRDRRVEMVDLELAADRTCRGEVGEAPRRQVVDDVDRLTVGEQPIDQVRTDEPGSSDDDDAHRLHHGRAQAATASAGMRRVLTRRREGGRRRASSPPAHRRRRRSPRRTPPHRARHGP